MKRILDILFVVATAPAWLLVGLAGVLVVLVFMGRPAFFVDERSGKNGVPFKMWKLRTMHSGSQADALRTPLAGKILRALSIDEIPQFFHVLTGKMSLVGPRALPVRYLPRYSPEQRRRLEVRPGITGLAQVMGRNSLSWDEKFAYDIEYVDNVSILLDLKIIALTVLRLVRPRGINHDSAQTMPEFK